MPKALKALLTSGFLLFVFFACLPTKIYAQQQGELTEYVEAVKSTDPNIQNTGTEMFKAISGAITVAAVGDGTEEGNSTSMIGSMGNTIAGMYGNPAADTQTYLADLFESAKIIEPAYAQGIGFASLTPILDTWKIFRNVAYFMFILVFLAIGFMIMFRQKIGGQTAVTAQQAIPRIIIALIMVTFSYAIAGLLIDLMYLSMYFLIGVMGESTDLLQGSIFSQGGKILTSASTYSSAFGAIQDFVSQAFGNNFLGDLGGLVAGITVTAIIAIALVFVIFQIFFELLKTYVVIIISVIFAPLVLMLNAIPGKNTFKSWVQGLIGNLAAFPILLLVLIIHGKLTEGVSASTVNGGGFLPPYLTGNGSAQAISVFVGIGALLVGKKMIEEGKKMMGAKEGVFGQFAPALSASLKQGWQGGQLIPGVGLSDTSKWPGGKFYGSGKGLVKTSTAIGGGIIGGATSGASELAINLAGKGVRTTTRGKYGWSGENPLISTVGGGLNTSRTIAEKTGLINKKESNKK